MQLTQRPEQPATTKTMAELLSLEMDRVAELEAMLRELVERFNPSPDFSYTPLGIWDRAALVLQKKPE